MKDFYTIALTEYKSCISAMEGSYCANIAFCAFLVAFYSIMHGIYKPFKRHAEIRHFGFLLANIIYLVAIVVGLDSKGFLFTLGGFACEASGYITRNRRMHKYLFIFSAIFIYTLYILLLAGVHLYASLAASTALSVGASCLYPKLHDVYTVTHILNRSVLIPLIFYSIAMFFTHKVPTIEYIENVSLFFISGTFTILLAQAIRNKYKKSI
ncbi:hypothetical protein NEMIN01_1052 [Nematocida minor]|uniref:uncharacterized protein n=1 Tax=Nematocida minor TaxID=1912983 RepID=UPI00222022D6|nr:uncharacterized protein NEMIN01_1052 [Nematocida minor]KAI5190428.1 hypothetical protein NEMIN01_1052 [Nematocida minor]